MTHIPFLLCRPYSNHTPFLIWLDNRDIVQLHFLITTTFHWTHYCSLLLWSRNDTHSSLSLGSLIIHICEFHSRNRLFSGSQVDICKSLFLLYPFAQYLRTVQIVSIFIDVDVLLHSLIETISKSRNVYHFAFRKTRETNKSALTEPFWYSSTHWMLYHDLIATFFY